MRRDLSTLDRDIGQPWSRIIQEAFKHGIDCDIIHGGLLEGKSEQGIHEVSTTQKYVIGTRRITPDGRVFRYALASATCNSNKGCLFDGTKIGEFEHFKRVQAKGDYVFQIDNTRSSEFTENQLKNGYAILHNADNSIIYTRKIVSNEATDGDGNTVITLESPWPITVTVDFRADLYVNIYAALTGIAHDFCSVAGVPAVEALVTEHFWVQTWGPCFCSAGGAGLGGEAQERQVGFDANGGLWSHSEADALTLDYQHAGFIIDKTSNTKDSPPFIMLQISP